MQDKIIILTCGLILLINSLALFLQDFNTLKIFIFLNIPIVLVFVFLYFYLKKFEIIEEKRKAFFQKLENFFDLLNTPFCLYTDDMKIVYFNKAFENFVGLKKEVLINFQVESWITKNPLYNMLSLVFFPALMATNIKVKENKPYEVIEVNFKNEVNFDVITTNVSFDNEKYNAKIIIDRTFIYKELKEKNEFISLMSHHIKTPLNQIRWAIESLSKLDYLKEPDREILNMVLNVINKATMLAESILLINRVEEKGIELEIKDNDIEEILNLCISMLSIEIKEKNLQVRIEIEEDAKKIFCDKKILFFAIYPIIENAVDYNKIGGEIFISVRKLEERPYIEIEIKDTGIGISSKELSKISDKFYRSSKAKEIKPTGTGIGLYLAKNLIKLHKGELKITSEENKGTSVLITIPAYKEIYE